MSDVSQGAGWWLASDGRWYPPQSHPAQVALPTVTQTAAATPTSIKKKTQQALARLVGPEVVLRSYALGSANARMTPLAVGLMGGFVVLAIALAVLSGRLLLPGFLVIYLIVRTIRPYRGVAAANSGIILFHCSPWSAKPKTVLGTAPFSVLWPPNAQLAGKKMRIPIGPDVVTLRQRDHEKLCQAVGAFASIPS